ncbi:monooxygenase [Lampropedia puyangensis]|uniref:Monooxygenase n=1 Tax=Lampropedia puyangensis TaxID=1330072 RepID=A0A4S8F3C6_9BURK|nr:YdhR family protein [Lampropedia puyangensis]THT99661.1 monooxygenase [Lampropedia puyangensis]
MITTITTFVLPKPIALQEAKAIFLSTAPKYQAVPGLLRKCYVLSEDGQTAGGVYLWQRREDAEAMYTDAWRAFVREKYQTEPQVVYFNTPVLVDNGTHEILTDD